MDFFKYAAIALQFINSDTLYVPLIAGGLCFLLVFIFQAVGLYVIAGREGYKNRWMAFVPFLNTYYIGVCGQKNRFFRNVNTKTISMIAAIAEALLFAGYLVYYIANFQLIIHDCLKPLTEDSVYGPITTYYVVLTDSSLGWAAWCYECLDVYILSWLHLIFLFLQVFVLSAFFQTYSSRRYLIFTIASIILPVHGILIFILRNNRGMDYREFIRMEQERQYRMYQQYASNYNDPYGNGNNQYYGGYQNSPPNSPRNKPASPDDPFSEYVGNGGKGGNNNDPFES